MIDVFNEEIEVLLKDGITNLYWFLGDLEKSWIRAGVDLSLTKKLFNNKDENGQKLTKRKLMDELYSELRNSDYNRRLEISRNFVRILTEHKGFVPQADGHRIDKAERVALKLKEIIQNQKRDAEYKSKIRERATQAQKSDYHSELLNIREQFIELQKAEEHDRGFKLENLFIDLMRISGIPVEEPFKIKGEQIDGAIKYDSHFYLIELKWRKKKANQAEIASLYMKADGKLEARGIFIAMEGYSDEVLQSLPKGKELKIILLNGFHLSNVIFGMYTFQELLEHSLSQISIKGNIYPTNDLKEK